MDRRLRALDLAARGGLALGAGGLARFVGTFVGGRLSDRVSRKAALIPGLLILTAFFAAAFALLLRATAIPAAAAWP